ncbi:MAG: hypothetical protein WC307_05215 [Candidatus Nanoarchaeia archaeon]|jgi:hypothetical protein
MIITMSFETFFKIRTNIRNAKGELDAGWYTETVDGFELMMSVNNYFIKAVVSNDELKKLERPDFNQQVVANKPVFFESMELSHEDFKKKYLNDFIEVKSFE